MSKKIVSPVKNICSYLFFKTFFLSYLILSCFVCFVCLLYLYQRYSIYSIYPVYPIYPIYSITNPLISIAHAHSITII